jgi:hypothetical protein
MPRREADEWSAVSILPGPVFHTTSRARALTIRLAGFDLDQRLLGRTWGNGVYTTPSREVADFYTRFHDPDPVILELRIRVQRLLDVRSPTGSRHDAIRQALAAIPGGYGRFIDSTLELRSIVPPPLVPAEAFTQVVVEAGYDGIEIVEAGISAAVGGTQIVVYDPRKVSVVDDEA